VSEPEKRTRVREGTSRTSLLEVARRAGVSVGTVSNVLNRPHLVAQATRERVQQVIEELEFVPNGGARLLRQGRSHAIGVVVLDIANPFWGEVVRGAEASAAQAGYVTIVSNAGESPEHETRALRALQERRVDGLLIAPVTDDEDRLERLQQSGIHVVLLDHPSSRESLRSVSVDDVLGGQLAVEHLLRLGHRRIGFVNGQLSIGWCVNRRAGVHAAVRAAGLDPDVCVVEVNTNTLTARDGEAAIDAVLDVADRPTAIFCTNDLLALGVLRGVTRRGLRVPDDLALIGYDDVEFAALLSPPLSTIRQVPYDLGRAAAELMLDAVAGTGGPHHLTFSPTLVVRGSTVATASSSCSS
jgi:LacI family transcriptional regulator